jgi:hypothetical protein
MRRALALTVTLLLPEQRLTLTADAGALPEDVVHRFAYDASLPEWYRRDV